MAEQNNKQASIKIEDKFKEVLVGGTLKNALNFATFLQQNAMEYDGTRITYNNECVCYTHIDGSEQMPGPWTIWPEGDFSAQCQAVPMSERMKEIAWACVNICTTGHCDSSPGVRKTVFGKVYDNACTSALAFTNPDAEALECLKKILLMRKNEIAAAKA